MDYTINTAIVLGKLYHHYLQYHVILDFYLLFHYYVNIIKYIDKEEDERTILLSVFRGNGNIKLYPHHNLEIAYHISNRFVVFKK